MRSFAIYPIIATLATLALFSTTTEVSALPVRGALGNLNTRARIARRAALVSSNNNNHSATLGKRFKIATKNDNALPANPKQQLLKNVKAAAVVREAENKVLHKKRDAGVVVDAVPSPVSSPASQTEIAPGANGMVLGLTRPSAVVQQNIVAPAALAVQDPSAESSASEESSDSSSESSSGANADNQEAIYQSYIDQLNDSITATVTVTSTSIVEPPVAPTNFQVAAVVPVQSAAPPAGDAQAIYNSYVAQMNAPAASAS